MHIALRLLRRVQHNVEPIKELAAPLLATFGSYHGEVRYEARALFIELIHSHISNYLFAGTFLPEKIRGHYLFRKLVLSTSV